MSSEGQCKLLGPFSLIIQSCLGLLSLSSLIYKRYKEYPNRRPWKVWFFDVSKQVFGAIGIHFLNLLLSILGGSSSTADPEAGLNVSDSSLDPYMQSIPTTGVSSALQEGFKKTMNVGVKTISFYLNINEEISNPCNWYFLNIFFDTTIGVPILWGLLYMVFKFAKLCGIEGINSGQYGVPPRLSYYFKQLALYFIGLFSMKLIVYILLMAVPLFEDVADLILSVFDPLPRLQVFMVTFVTPLVMNSLQYILIDNIIQSPEYKKAKTIRIGDHETLFNNPELNNEDILRANLPQEGLLGQSEPEEFEGELVRNKQN